MAKTDFLKSWVVNIETPDVVVEIPSQTFCIIDDGEEKVLVRYCCFGPRFPSIQNGIYDEHEDVVVAMTEGMELMTFKRSDVDGEELVTSFSTPGKEFRSRVMSSGLRRTPARREQAARPRQETTLTKRSYLGSWTVNREGGPIVPLASPDFRIYPDPADPDNGQSVIIHYCRFGSDYPTFQNGYVDSESVVGMMPSNRRLRLHRKGELIGASIYEGVDGAFGDGQAQWTATLREK